VPVTRSPATASSPSIASTRSLLASRIALFALGGTIATSWRGPEGSSAISLSADDLLRSLPDLGTDISVRAESFRLCSSGDLSPGDIIELAGVVTTAVSAGADGVVVTQGTNTLEETAFLLDCLVATDAPLVVTGAMRSRGAPGADGPANLLAALRVAASPLAAGLGALVVFNDEVHAARFVVKAHSTSPGAFRSVNAGALGWVVEGRVRVPLVPRQRTPAVRLPPGTAQLPSVGPVRLSLGDDGAMLRLAGGAGWAGLVVEVYGAGHASALTIGR
jgi:L-asparaginase